MTTIFSIIAFVLEIFGNWKVGNKRRYAFLVKCGGSLAWMITGLLSGIHALTVSAIVGFIVSVRSYHKWGNHGRDD